MVGPHTLGAYAELRREHLGQRGKRKKPDEALTEQQRKRRAYQAAYYQRRKAARGQQPAEPAE